MTNNIQDTLAERGARYGTFADHAALVGKFIEVAETGRNWPNLRYDSAQAIRVIFDKIARVLNGDQNYDDNWHDISGYATLVADRIRKEQG